jgi:hypothetical protein
VPRIHKPAQIHRPADGDEPMLIVKLFVADGESVPVALKNETVTGKTTAGSGPKPSGPICANAATLTKSASKAAHAVLTAAP